ncbi:hypothetical protein HanIR_Chr08g0348271 [Helianthus annuus]|nr:hypothetical protein HanIR_Chr08g0348271 [Helianthus annuus]
MYVLFITAYKSCAKLWLQSASSKSRHLSRPTILKVDLANGSGHGSKWVRVKMGSGQNGFGQNDSIKKGVDLVRVGTGFGLGWLKMFFKDIVHQGAILFGSKRYASKRYKWFDSKRFGSKPSKRFDSKRYGLKRFASKRLNSKRYGSKRFDSKRYWSKRFASKRYFLRSGCCN